MSTLATVVKELLENLDVNAKTVRLAVWLDNPMPNFVASATNFEGKRGGVAYSIRHDRKCVAQDQPVDIAVDYLLEVLEKNYTDRRWELRVRDAEGNEERIKHVLPYDEAAKLLCGDTKDPKGALRKRIARGTVKAEVGKKGETLIHLV